MKTKYIVLGLLMSMTLSVNARAFLANDEIRVYTDQTYHDGEIHWDWDYSVLWLYLFNTDNSNTLWLQLQYVEDNWFSATIPAGSDFNRLILVRKASGKGSGWSDIVNQTCNIQIPDEMSCNVLYKFWKKSGDCSGDGYSEWKTYTPSINIIKATVPSQAETIEVCPQAKGSYFSLHAKIRSDHKDYDYDNVSRHTWLCSTDGMSTWTSLDNYAGKVRDEEYSKDSHTKLPNPIPAGGVYYYLYSHIPAGRRLIHVTPTATQCDYDCDITAFETANSAVNADNNTFTLDGMVAFGEANGKALVISCEGVDTTITTPKSPQSFSLNGVPAATENGKKATATAYFVGGSAACSMDITIDLPNATVAADTIKQDSLTGKEFVLIPQDTIASNLFVWLKKDNATGKLDTVKSTWKKLTIDAMSHDSTVTYIYKEYNPAPGSMSDIMKNGSYEDNANYGVYGQTSTISDYDFWGRHPETASECIQFYDTSSLRIPVPGKPGEYLPLDNGFAVVQKASNFYDSYAEIPARAGNYFALFDAKSGAEGANKKAWYATTAQNSDLVLHNGTTYVLSFWAANINNYGEMDNAAQFRFYIEDISNPAKPVKLDSSEVLDLNLAKYRNNLWHQCSKTYTAKADYSNVRISVVNLNKKELKIGNDFALDDIQFHPISAVSRNVKSQQVFVVTAHEPKVDAFTATVVPLDCDAKPNYTVKMHVEFQNPKGQLIIKDVTTNTEYPYAVSAPFDTPTTLDTNIVITGLIPATHTWDAYFEDWTTAQISGVTTDAPVVPTIDTLHISFSDPGCTELTTTLTFDLDYTYQRGTLTYWVDALPKQTATYTLDDPTKQTLTGLTVANIPADGKNNHVLHVSFDGTNSCVKDYALPTVPFSPVISSVTVSVPATVQCKDNDYPVSVSLVTPYDATGRNIVLSGSKDTTIVATGTSTTVAFKLTDIGAAVSHTVIAAYEATPTCTTSSTPFTPPTRVSCEKLDTTICEGQTVTWKGTVYSGTVGQTDTIVVGLDSLILTVYVVPAITIQPMDMFCDNEANILIPFKTTAGNPDMFDVVINDVHYAGIAVGSDISFPRGAELVAGDYTATVTVGESGSDCSSQATVNFTLAAGDLMYSKWTDVLFISNADGRFVSYQWYKNGSLMYGETQQRLYYSKGLRGTYQCVMTTKDGKTIYTCPQDFEDVQPSRSAGPEPNKVQTEMYDAMGRTIKGQPSKGIYVVIEEIDGERTAKKIIVSE